MPCCSDLTDLSREINQVILCESWLRGEALRQNIAEPLEHGEQNWGWAQSPCFVSRMRGSERSAVLTSPDWLSYVCAKRQNYGEELRSFMKLGLGNSFIWVTPGKRISRSRDLSNNQHTIPQLCAPRWHRRILPALLDALLSMFSIYLHMPLCL